jgi:hypothetical protein
VPKYLKFIIPFVISLVATPGFLFIGLASAGAGHGNYFLAKVFFPFTMVSTVPFGSITSRFVVLGVLQYPLYGLLVGMANLMRKAAVVGIALAIIHTLAVVACLILIGENFS